MKLKTIAKFLIPAICMSIVGIVPNAAQAQALWAQIDQNELHVTLSDKPGEPCIEPDKVQKSVVTANGQTLALTPQDGKANLAAALPPNTNLVGVSNEWGVIKSNEPDNNEYHLRYYAKAARTLKDAADPVDTDAQWYARYQYGQPARDFSRYIQIGNSARFRTIEGKEIPVILRLVKKGKPVIGARVKIYYAASKYYSNAMTDKSGEIFLYASVNGMYNVQAEWNDEVYRFAKTSDTSDQPERITSHEHNRATLSFYITDDALKNSSPAKSEKQEDVLVRSWHSHVFAMRFSSDNKKLITTGIITKTEKSGYPNQPLVSVTDDKRLRVWNVATGKEFGRLPTKPKIEYYPSPWDWWSLKYAVGTTLIMPDFKTMYTPGDGGYNIFDIHSFRIVGSLRAEHNRSSIQLSPNGKLLAVGATRNAYIFDVKTHKMLHDFGNEGQGTKVFWGPHSKTLLCSWGGWYGPQAFDLETNKQIHYPRWVYRVWGSDAFAFSPDGNFLAKAKDHTVEIWETPTATSAGKKLNTFTTKIDLVRVMQFSPDGKTLAVGGSSKTEVPVQFLTLSQTRK